MKAKKWVVASIGVLIFLTVACGIYFKHYFVIFVFGVWLCAEVLLLKLRELMRISVRKVAQHRSPPPVTVPLSPRAECWELYRLATSMDLNVLELRLSEMKEEPSEKEWVRQVKYLLRIEELFAGSVSPHGKIMLRRAMLPFAEFGSDAERESLPPLNTPDFSRQDIMEAAVWWCDSLKQLQRIAEAGEADCSAEAQRLLGKLLQISSPTSYDALKVHARVENLIDSMQRDGGIPFLMLNLLRQRQFESAKAFGARLLQWTSETDEDLRSTLYWMSEVLWFTSKEGRRPMDHDATIRHLYHLCFTNPERAGFLEIDSLFFGEFSEVNEIAQEGFLFKEALIESALDLWGSYEGWFDSVFQGVLETLSGRKSKIYDEREHWLRFWRHEAASFSRDYLYVVEGNLCFVSEEYEDACACYEKALKENPTLRPALFNSLFVYAKLKDAEKQAWAVERILSLKDLMPLGLSVIANAYLLSGNEAQAERYLEELRNTPGWERKADHYAATFCFEQQQFERALQFARRAHELNPTDSSISFHLSRCYSVVGENERALALLKSSKYEGQEIASRGQSPAWINYYRFTLERDSGLIEDASETLLHIPLDYFEDPNELEAAQMFARSKQDFKLMRHLKSRE